MTDRLRPNNAGIGENLLHRTRRGTVGTVPLKPLPCPGIHREFPSGPKSLRSWPSPSRLPVQTETKESAREVGAIHLDDRGAPARPLSGSRSLVSMRSAACLEPIR